MSLLLSLCAAGYQMAPPPHFATNLRPYASRVTPIMDVSLSDHELCVYLCKTTLKEQPGWAEGKGITTTLLASQIEEWTDDLDDEFYDAIFALEEAGFLRVDDNADDEDVLFNAAAITGDSVAATLAAPTEQLPAVHKATLAAQPGWSAGKGISLTNLANLIDEWKEDDDELDEKFYDAIDSLESAGWLRVENSEDDDMLYSTSSAAAVAEGGGSPIFDTVPSATATVAASPLPSPPLPPSSAPLPAKYDLEAEAAAAAAVSRAIAPLKRFGVDKDDATALPALQDACSALTMLLDQSGGPALRDDPRLIGDGSWLGRRAKTWRIGGGSRGSARRPSRRP